MRTVGFILPQWGNKKGERRGMTFAFHLRSRSDSNQACASVSIA